MIVLSLLMVPLVLNVGIVSIALIVSIPPIVSIVMIVLICTDCTDCTYCTNCTYLLSYLILIYYNLTDTLSYLFSSSLTSYFNYIQNFCIKLANLSLGQEELAQPSQAHAKPSLNLA